ncbi:hypothetical protein [uncultured Thiodictyon sp.]|jgi:hypothetical protein|uniref:hypothetical protein n=1 Tax=uncultured Thiodictyon sp. TaxID=1846217 RepID=UPI0025D432CF|nr:hypothetical protein [uncultured Thiodictyon sp.]
MRKDHYSAPVKWTREFRQALKLGDLHFKLYAYLEGGPESHATGLYFVTPAAIGEMIREDRESVLTGLEDLESIGLILWDRAADVVLVHAVCAEQYRWRKTNPKGPDLRVIEGRRHLRALPRTQLLDLFLGRWPIFQDDAEGAYQGASEGAYQGAWQGATPTTRTASPSDAPNGPPVDPRAEPDPSAGDLGATTGKRRGGVL